MINEKYPHRCISLNITQDTVQESQEYFTVNITRAEIVNTPKYNQIMMIKLEPASTVVFIEDDDSKSRPQSVTYSVHDYLGYLNFCYVLIHNCVLI